MRYALAALLMLCVVCTSCSNNTEEEATLAWCEAAATARVLPSPDLLAARSDLSTTLTLTQTKVDDLARLAPGEVTDASQIVAQAYAGLVEALVAVGWDGLEIKLKDYRPAVSVDMARASATLDAFDRNNCGAPDGAGPLAFWERLLVAGTPAPGEIAEDATFRDVLVANVAGEVEMTAEQRSCVTERTTQETIDRLIELLAACDVAFG